MGLNLPCWDGEKHISFDYDLFKHLCVTHGVLHRWNMMNRLNWDVALDEALVQLEKIGKKWDG